ncbi:helix-turn-helix domain-containing protein [Streptomyces litchfieldiae]|uniref:Helix-turn-helix domain-containing protein n=1 Tax=Streptomyces litchfieldiae TaxID=3075543 RepID=A0ABU2MUJ5_9ACTN|nr:helix-turn-helix domain-containing protein [Streptomyces sp. DSM 44938]MDT0345320.1 helix-turn-helix domain-containing protein [Streptomyces sp. DSM 44938]
MSSFVLHIPRALLPLPDRTLQRLTAVPFPARQGMAGVLSRWLNDLNARAHELTPADVPTLASITTDLLASLLGRLLHTENLLPPEARRRALQAQIRDFIREHLADPAPRTRAVQAIATRWGLTDAAHFSRLFRATFGMPPRHYRHQAIGVNALPGSTGDTRKR